MSQEPTITEALEPVIQRLAALHERARILYDTGSSPGARILAGQTEGDAEPILHTLRRLPDIIDLMDGAMAVADRKEADVQRIRQQNRWDEL